MAVDSVEKAALEQTDGALWRSRGRMVVMEENGMK